VKEALAGTTLDQDSLKTAWEGVIRTITADDFATAFRRWFQRAKKCVWISGDFAEKS
jgi:predicted Zn-dependent peptidase